MYNIDTKNIKKGYKIWIIFLIIGIVIFGILSCVFTSNHTKYKDLDSSTLSTNVDYNEYEDDEDGTMYKPTYYYKVSGYTYSCESKWSTSMKPKRTAKIYYSSNNPRNCLTASDKTANSFLLLFLLLPLSFIIIGLVGILKINKRIQTIKELNTRGRLIRNLPYHLENSNVTINDHPLKKIVILYTLNGQELKLSSDPRYDTNNLEETGFADLLIDESNPKNYYIDLHIN